MIPVRNASIRFSKAHDGVVPFDINGTLLSPILTVGELAFPPSDNGVSFSVIVVVCVLSCTPGSFAFSVCAAGVVAVVPPPALPGSAGGVVFPSSGVSVVPPPVVPPAVIVNQPGVAATA